jgi:hypothetical protein
MTWMENWKFVSIRPYMSFSVLRVHLPSLWRVLFKPIFFSICCDTNRTSHEADIEISLLTLKSVASVQQIDKYKGTVT